MKMLAVCSFIVVSLGFSASAQERVNVGAVLKYTGLPSNVDELRTTNLYLRTLESQVASETIGLNGVRYIDRVSVDEIFREKNLSEDAAFNPSSGALTGLLGRLDLLVVLDANDGSLARLRLIDLEDGSVRAVANCKRGYFSSADDGSPDCVKGFVAKIAPVTREISSTKEQRKAKAARESQEAAEKARQAEAAEDARQAAAARQAADERRAAARRAADERRAAEATLKTQEIAEREREEENQKQIGLKQAAVAALQPRLDDNMARLQEADRYWGHMQQTMASEGRSVRSDIQSTLRAANTAGTRCQGLARNLDSAGLSSCISELASKLDSLDNYK